MSYRRFCGVAVGILLAAVLSRPVLADDLADEADLHFKLGTERYASKDFRGALEHFLISNRLVPNRNVLFNIARSYDQLQEYPTAFRFYTQVIEQETDPKQRERVEEALQRLRPNVAILSVRTDPPGATVFIDRRNLGPRGTTPRQLAFRPGRYRVLVEMPGYEPMQAEPVDVGVGEERVVNLKLTRIVGTLHLETDTPGAVIRIDDPNGPVVGQSPADLVLGPGQHRLYLNKEGYQTTDYDINIPARGTVSTRVRMLPLMGSLVVNTDERDALVEVDGKPKGFTPSVLSIESGKRSVTISRQGFRPVTREVVIRPNEQTRIDVDLRQVEEVEAASRTTENVEDAPSSVTIIPGQELRAMGYPTIAEALRGVRGVFLTDDASYVTAGIRGFSRTSDYGDRVLVLINGQAFNDNWVGSQFIGFDARTDLEDVERIEVVRGPGSVLYGTGAFSGVINVVTRGRPSRVSANVGVGISGNSTSRARVGFDVPFGRDAGMWNTFAAARSYGRDFFFPERVQAADPAVPGSGSDGSSRDADGFDAGMITGRAWFKALSAQWIWSSRSKSFPTGIYSTELGNADTRFADTRGIFELRFDPKFSQYFSTSTRAVLNTYRFNGRYAYPLTDTRESSRERFKGSWATFEQRFVISPSESFRLTVGGELQSHFQVAQQGIQCDRNTTGPGCSDTQYLPGLSRVDPGVYDEHAFSIWAVYGLADITPARWMRLSAGARVDNYSTSGSSGLNPRLALILHPYEQGTVKLMGGRAFRAPNIFEQFYSVSGYWAPNTNLDPETIWSGELEYTHRFTTTVSAVASGFINSIDNLITLRGSGDANDPYKQSNTGAPVLTAGGEFELRRDWRQGWMASVNYSYQHSHYRGTGSSELREVPNSPEHMGSLRAAAPLLGRDLTLATRITVEGPRWDVHEQASDPEPQRKTQTSAVWDVVLSGRAEPYGLQYSFGVYNIGDWRYTHPASTNFNSSQRTIVQNGRTVLASAMIRF